MLSETSDSLTELLPLRGLKDRGYQLDKNGSAFVLHTACFYRYRGIEKVRTARIWLLNVPDEKSRINLQLVNFEWTDPGDHLVGFN